MMSIFTDSGIYGYNWRYIILHPWFLLDQTYRRAKWFVQRGYRGYSDSDSWSIDAFLLKILPPMLRNLQTNGIGCPMEFEKNPEEWKRRLHVMILGLEANRRLMDLDYDYHNKAYESELMLMSTMGLHYIFEHFNDLWD